jgi:hypothetical protein
MIHYDFEQGTPEWLESRKGCITGSKFRDARDRLKNGNPSSKAILYAKDVARERCGGTAEKVFQNAAMKFGSEQEKFAIQAYETKTGNLAEPVGFFKTEDGMFGLSPDSLINDDGVLEVKTMVSSDTLFTAVADGDISAYQDQCDGYLWLLGRKWVDLVLWAPDMADLGLDMVIHRITRNEERIEKLEADLMAFSLTVRTYESALRKAAAANKEKVSA